MRFCLIFILTLFASPAFADDVEDALYYCYEHTVFDANVPPKDWKFGKGFEVCNKAVPILEARLADKKLLLVDQRQKRFWDTIKKVMAEKH